MVYVADRTWEPPTTSNPLRKVPVLHRYQVLVKTSGSLKLCAREETCGFDRVIVEVTASLERSSLGPKTLSGGHLGDDYARCPYSVNGAHTFIDNALTQPHVGVYKQQVVTMCEPRSSVSLSASFGTEDLHHVTVSTRDFKRVVD
jgi:hypothetical protein